MQPGGISNVNYGQDTAIVRTGTQWLLLIALLVFVFTLPLYANDFILSLLSMTGITIITVLGLNILTGYCGQISLGQAGLMAAGAFGSGVF